MHPFLIEVSVCYSTDKLGCGYEGSGLVCCPQTTQYTTTVGHSGCGIPAVQGQNFDGIGAQPWVAQIGFRSKLRVLSRISHITRVVW